MNDLFFHLDRSLFHFCNQDLRNWLFDFVLPFLTDLNKKPIALVVVGILWLLLLTRGGRNGRIAALLLIPTIILSDQLNSSFLKYVINRPRPCHELEHVRLLVTCGSGFSFPSSHAVNTFAGAIVLGFFLPRCTWAFLCFAAVIAFSRVYVGVHYPSDVIAGAVLGSAIGGLIIYLYRAIEERWLARRLTPGTRR